MNKKEAIDLLFNGGMVQAEGWDADRYIVIDGSTMVDQNGEPFDMMKAKATEWHEWEEPVEKSEALIILSKKEAIDLLFDGGMVQAEGWDADSYIVIDGSTMVDQDGEPFDMMKAKATEWHEWKEPVEKRDTDVMQEIVELRKMLEESLRDKSSDAPVAKRDDETAHDKIMAVYGVDSSEKVRKLFRDALENAESEKDVQIAIVHAIPYCWIGRSLRTTKAYYAEMRNIVKEVGGEYEALALDLLLPPYRTEKKIIDGVETDVVVGLYQALNKADESKVVAKLGSDIDTYDRDLALSAIARLKKMIDENDYEKKKQTSEARAKAYVYASYLAMVTGRRQIEILYTLDIKKEGDTWFYEGLAKKNAESKIRAYSLDEDFEKLAEMLEYVQEHILEEMEGKTVTAKTISAKFNASFNTAIKNLTGLPYKFSDWREISTDLITIEHCERGEVDCENPVEVESFKAKVLGHSVPEGSLRATLHYMTKKAK